MKILPILIICICCSIKASAQNRGYWQQRVDYSLRVSLNDSAKSLEGSARITYYNQSPDTLNYIWFHLWPNAYANDRTAFSEQLLQNGRTDFYFARESERGYISGLEFRSDDTALDTEAHPVHPDIRKIFLPEPLLPGTHVRIQTPFFVRLPKYVSRGGYIDSLFCITQWYPKPAVYDKYGWHEMPYLDQGEFYSDFGQFDVTISVPENYALAGSGRLVDKNQADGRASYHYVQDSIHDFAWFAGKDWILTEDSMRLGNRDIRLAMLVSRSKQKAWSNGLTYLKRAIRTKSEWVGEYPYGQMTMVENPSENADGGMEYPCITLIAHPGNEPMLDYLINHETGHNWFYGILASEERKYPWMDEGMNSYYDKRYIAEFYKTHPLFGGMSKSSFIRNRLPKDPERWLTETMISLREDQPINTASERFTDMNYGLIPYGKAADWLQMLEQKMGTAKFDSLMRTYYRRWAFRHPYPEDFRMLADSIYGQSLSDHFALLDQKGSLQKQSRKKIKLSAFFNFSETEKYHYIHVLPAAGYNMYDRAMIGAIIHNYNLPVSRFRFLVAPMYGSGSKSFNGLGRASYHIPGRRTGEEWSVSVAGARFTADDFTDDKGQTYLQPFSKFVPSIRYNFGRRDPRSTARAYIQWKTFLFRETGLSFRIDTASGASEIGLPERNRYLNQLRFHWEDNRALYPYEAVLDAEQGRGFVRLAFTGQYFFNYGKEGGLQARLFAGKFIYTGDRTFLSRFETDRYHLNMTGPKGYEDYTYANYFIGRNEFEGLANQQIMMRDGGFKVRTDLLSNKVGKTDDWLAAINLSSSIPKQINPLTVLPIRIPVRVFADIGTYAEAWDSNSGNSRFLYDAGFQLSLFNDVLQVYVPVLYSKVYRDYIRSTIPDKKFLRNISFSIDIQQLQSLPFFRYNAF